VTRGYPDQPAAKLSCIRRVDSSLVHLWLDLESWIPAVEVHVDSEFGEPIASDLEAKGIRTGVTQPKFALAERA
jgi:hypothetical protein